VAPAVRCQNGCDRANGEPAAARLMPRRVSRRSFLIMAAAVSAGTGAGLVWWMPRKSGDCKGFEPNLWIRIDTDGLVHLTIHKCEMGQGVLTALAMLIAEELEVEWSRVRVTQADCDFRFPDQNTSGSTSVVDGWIRLREAGAIARMMLVRAAAGRWRVAESECGAKAGVVSHVRTGRRAGYGELAPLAASVAPPARTPYG
jgi:isoquinoline 1-oxidoreductase beta subunit